MTTFLVPALGMALALTASAHAPLVTPPVAAGAAAVPTDEPLVESFAVKGSKIERVKATVAVRAPIDEVRAVVFDFPRYPRFVPRYKKASIVSGSAATGQTVQMELEELGGLVHFSMRVEIAPPAHAGDVESYDGHLVRGNVKAFFTRWELEPLGRDRTRLTLESFFDPDISIASASMVNNGARSGMRATILALKGRSEGRAVTNP